jgi:hypothetical protein
MEPAELTLVQFDFIFEFVIRRGQLRRELARIMRKRLVKASGGFQMVLQLVRPEETQSKGFDSTRKQ